MEKKEKIETATFVYKPDIRISNDKTDSGKEVEIPGRSISYNYTQSIMEIAKSIVLLRIGMDNEDDLISKEALLRRTDRVEAIKKLSDVLIKNISKLNAEASKFVIRENFTPILTHIYETAATNAGPEVKKEYDIYIKAAKEMNKY